MRVIRGSLRCPAVRSARVARGGNRRPARVGEDDALHGADEGRRRRVRQDERRHGADRGRAARRAGPRRLGAEDHAGRDPRAGRAGHRARRCSGTCARSTRCSSCSTASRPAPTRRATSRTSSSSCSSPTATTSRSGSSGSRSRRSRATRSSAPRSRSSARLLAHIDAGAPLSDYAGELPPRARAADDEAAARASRTARAGSTSRSRPSSPELDDEEAAAFRDGGASALEEVVRRLRDALELITFFTAGDKETRAWTLREGETALDAAETIHSDIARGFIRCEVIDWSDLVESGSHAEASRRGLQRLEGKTYRCATATS